MYGNMIDLAMLIHVSRVRSHIASRVTWHAHEGFEILFLLEGSTAYEFANQQTVELNGGHFLVVPPGIVHRGVHNVRAPSTICGVALKALQPNSWRNTTFTPRDLQHLREALEKAGQKVHPFSPVMRWLVRRLLEETTHYPDDPHPAEAGMALRALICSALVEIVRQVLVPPNAPKEFVMAAIAYLRRHLHESVRMSDLVKHVGFSRARLFDIFKAQTGLTPNHYLQRLRIEKAQEQLRKTDQTVTEIALATGFSSGQYFSTVFGRYTGVSPTRFRKGAEPKSWTRLRGGG